MINNKKYKIALLTCFFVFCFFIFIGKAKAYDGELHDSFEVNVVSISIFRRGHKQTLALDETLPGLDTHGDASTDGGTSALDTDDGSSGALCAILFEIYDVLKYAVAALMLVFSALDLTKATLASDAEGMKKAQKNVGVRLGAGVLIFLLPMLIVYIFSIVGFDVSVCGLNN